MIELSGEKIMEKMGFPNHFVNLIMRCVSTVSYSILINGNPSPSFCPSRVLRQGDPLSPYLFLLCAEALSGLIRKAESQNLLSGIKICRRSPVISHLFFADDSIIFDRATRNEI